MLGNLLLGTLLGNLFLVTLPGNHAWEPCWEPLPGNLAWEPCLGTSCWEPLLGNLFLGTSWEHVPGNLAWEPLPGNLAWEPLPGNLAWEPLPGNPVPNLAPCGFGCSKGFKRKPFRNPVPSGFGCSDLLRNLYYGWRPQAYTVGEKLSCGTISRYQGCIPFLVKKEWAHRKTVLSKSCCVIFIYRSIHSPVFRSPCPRRWSWGTTIASIIPVAPRLVHWRTIARTLSLVGLLRSLPVFLPSLFHLIRNVGKNDWHLPHTPIVHVPTQQ